MSTHCADYHCKYNCAASVKKKTPLTILPARVHSTVYPDTTLTKLAIEKIVLDIINIMRHNLFIIKLGCSIIMEGNSMAPTKNLNSDKLEKLKKSGALNPHPEKVKEELFLNSALDFFDPHDLIQVKYEMLRSVDKEGRSVTEASKIFGFSRPSFYQTQSQFKKEGITGFIRERSGPKSAHKLSDEIIEFIEERIEKGQPIRARKLSPLILKKFNKKVHPRSIERAIARRKKRSA